MTENDRLPVSFQLYSSRNFPPENQLTDLKSIGCDAVEPRSIDLESDPEEFRRKLDEAGLSCFGFHVPLDDLEKDPSLYADCAQAVGANKIIVPAVPKSERMAQPEFWIEVGAALMRAGEKVADRNCKVLWHNHDGEYARLPDGTLPLDRLFEGAGGGVGFEIDCGWVARAGASLADELARLQDRICAIHLKDISSCGLDVEDGWTAVGDGLIDWPALVGPIKQLKLDHLVVEHDNPADWKKFASRSITYLRGIGL